MGAVCLLAALFLKSIPVAAGTIYSSPYVTFSPDQRAWTTDAEDQNIKWYREGGADDVDTGIPSGLAQLQEGEHYYETWRVGNIPVSKWQVSLSRVNCCHMDYPDADQDYHGIRFERKVCLRPHYSAWVPICADCGKAIISANFYMSREAAESITYLEAGTGLSYYYLCPFNRNLEQGVALERHRCRAVSKNKYCVEYLPNTDGAVYAGYMEHSFHFYDNATIYEGREITPQTHLNPNQFHRIGYRFCGWNTKADGTGYLYEDEAEIKNLCAEQYDPETNSGKVQLYAMWQKCSGELKLLLENCIYKGQTGMYSIIGEYGECCQMETEQLVPPDGSKVSLDMGDGEVSEIRGKQHLVEWVPINTLKGTLLENTYWFYVPDGNIDVIRPVFARDSVILPCPVREGQSFGGWYYDRDFLEFAGAAGDAFLTEEDVTLYARWVELHLDAVDNYTAFNGCGAVDLRWMQPDNREKVYQVLQSMDGRNWSHVYTQNEIGGGNTVTYTVMGDGKEHVFLVPYSGAYQVEAYGAQGGNYGAYLGGRGGYVKGNFWLEKGERVVVRAGMQYGDDSGGQGNLYAGGGGYSLVETDRKGLILIAGGGGGAAENGDGLQGGSSQNLIAGSRTGEPGGSGGGGGCQGGRAGEVLVHHHTPGVCNHVHDGNAEQYGGCYTVPVVCGRELQHVYTGSTTWYWGGYNGDYCPNCGADASKGETCTGHEEDNYSHICPVHGEIEGNTDSSEPSVCPEIAYYAAGCGRTEDPVCGYTENQIISSRPAYGGSSYVNGAVVRAVSMQPGVRTGDGMILLQSKSIGYHSETELRDVKAADRGKPEQVCISDVERAVEGVDVIRVQWKEPKDTGTKYFHQVKSYTINTLENIGISNVTENTLISGIAGYYYHVDAMPLHDFRKEEYAFTEQTQLRIVLKEEVQYLHIAPADVAENVGEVAHIPLGTKYKGPEDVRWKLHTEPLKITEGSNVYWSVSEDRYYVKCDGKTPFSLRYAAFMEGPASAGFQLNYNIIESIPNGGVSAQSIVAVPLQAEPKIAEEFRADGLEFRTRGTPLIHMGDYVAVSREHAGRNVTMKQEYVLEKTAENVPVRLIPIAGAKTQADILYSERAEDEGNGLIIVGDGTPPVIHGADGLEQYNLLDRRNGQVILQLVAEDEISGVREFYAEIVNKDNGGKRKLYPDGTGKIRIDLTEDIPVFSGDFTITVTAVDNVGNEKTVVYTTLEFDLQAKLTRVLEPHEPVFRKGESGMLKITTWGYAERVEVEFPEEMSQVDDGLDRVYIYDLKTDYKQEETIEFEVPLYMQEGADYRITVRAYKGDAMIEQYPAFAVMDVSGTVLDELRTRLR